MESRVTRADLSAFADRMNLSGTDLALSPGRLRIEILSGLTVALALVPEAVAFAFVAGVHPLVASTLRSL